MAPKSSPGEIAARVLEGIASGTEDILADERSRTVFAELHKDDRAFDGNMQKICGESEVDARSCRCRCNRHRRRSPACPTRSSRTALVSDHSAALEAQ
jgi:hypothetical protein